MRSPITLSSASERRNRPLCWQSKPANPIPATCWWLACPRGHWIKLFSTTFPCWLSSPPIHLGVIPRGQPLGPPHHQQRGCPLQTVCLVQKPQPCPPHTWFFRVKPVSKVPAGVRNPSDLPIEAMPPLHHPNNIQNAGWVGRGAVGGCAGKSPTQPCQLEHRAQTRHGVCWLLISPPAASSKMQMLGRGTC